MIGARLLAAVVFAVAAGGSEGCGQAGASHVAAGDVEPEPAQAAPAVCPPAQPNIGRHKAPAVASGAATSEARPAGGGPVSWLKGSTHVHTCHSGDSDMAVAEAVAWYREHGYDFIVITDHNRVTEVESAGRPLVLRGIELTHNPGSCEPAPSEVDGKCRIHLNGVGLARSPFVATGGAVALAPGGRPPVVDWKNETSKLRVDMYQAGIDKVRELGGLAQINHPSWHWGVDGELLAALGRRGAVLVEIANMGFGRWNAGDAVHASSEAVWDAALSQGVMVYGVASDDAHDYVPAEIEAKRAAGRPVYRAGTGWVMVRASRRPDSIRAALARGDFYSSTGVTLERLERSGRAIEIDVAAASPGEHTIVFVGQGGAELERVTGRSARFSLERAPVQRNTDRHKAPAGYVRAVVTRADGARAWVQPVRVPSP